MTSSNMVKKLSELPDIRSMANEVMALTQADMEAVVYNEEVPVVIRRIAKSLLRGNIKEMATILDQALGKPIERHMTLTKQVNPLEGLTTDEIRALLAMGEAEDGDGHGEE